MDGYQQVQRNFMNDGHVEDRKAHHSHGPGLRADGSQVGQAEGQRAKVQAVER